MNPLFEDLVSDKYPLTQKRIDPRPDPDPSLTPAQVKQFNALVNYVTQGGGPLFSNQVHCIYRMIELIAALEYFQENYTVAKQANADFGKDMKQQFKECKKDLKELYRLFMLNRFKLRIRGLPLVGSFRL